MTNLGGRPRLTARVEDAHDLLDAGEDPERVASRLGTTVGALARLCERHGRPHRGLARAADRARKSAERRAAA